ncbi:hypothetical protein J2751_000517 [Halorubrum alkaliphilum]|uniref:Uncharacterized protein n=1 Tax=Halorubrum alkaliphilum TaxID=261290 RepID=A0A8T4GAT3_9EURY|nr:hypothetical protein [Halorubrum alkaliphilum]MBP1921524.1 hypothetical protein [Halorubrum alkaliphilum]
MDTSSRLSLWLRNPRYTGENRCVPCTLVNLLIAVVLAVGVAIVSTAWALVVLVAAVATIAVRGYLVPGTPALTKRYLPDRVLVLFDKAPERATVGFDGTDVEATAERNAVPQEGPDAPESTEPVFDAARVLVDGGVLVDDPVADDLVVDASFREAWERRSRELADRGSNTGQYVDTDRDSNADRRALARFLDIDPDSVSLVDRGYAYVASIDGEPAGRWESRPAFVADLAASDVLTERWADWTTLPTAHRSELLGSLRLFVETCPTCDGTVTLDSTVVESCCRQYDVLAATCGDCGTRLFEADVDPEALERIANPS